MNYEKLYYVDEDDAEKRIDRYLADYETEHSRTYIQKLIADGNVTVNGKTVTDFGSSGNGQNHVEIEGGIGAVNLNFKEE